MNMRAAVILGVGFLILVPACNPAPRTPASPPAPQTVNSDEALKNLKSRAAEVSRAATEADHERLADLTYPTVVEGMGGRTIFVARLKAMADEMRDKGFRVKHIDVGEPVGPVESAGDLYAVVPYVLTMAVPGDRFITQAAYYIAVSADKGVVWKFLDGSAVGGDRGKLRQVMPNFPQALQLPAGV